MDALALTGSCHQDGGSATPSTRSRTAPTTRDSLSRDNTIIGCQMDPETGDCMLLSRTYRPPYGPHKLASLKNSKFQIHRRRTPPQTGHRQHWCPEKVWIESRRHRKLSSSTSKTFGFGRRDTGGHHWRTLPAKPPRSRQVHRKVSIASRSRVRTFSSPSRAGPAGDIGGRRGARTPNRSSRGRLLSP